MNLDVGDIYAYAQDFFRRGVVIVVGSGASCGYGLPSMSQLSDHLLEAVPARIVDLGEVDKSEWHRISAALEAGASLEEGIGEGILPKDLAAALTSEIANYVRTSEATAISSILDADRTSAFGRLFAHILRTTKVADVITTNYDRLIEVHAARADVRVDTMYYGHTIGRLGDSLSRAELLHQTTFAGRGSIVRLEYRPHIRLAKPHGSLDWFESGERHYRSDLALPGSEQIIAPGGNKYRLGYEVPFDAHRQRANGAIDQAAAFFCVGYGFNDEHLQTHLRTRFGEVPAVVLSRHLTASAREYLTQNPSAIGIESDDEAGCRITKGVDSVEIDLPLWDLDTFAKEVLAI